MQTIRLRDDRFGAVKYGNAWINVLEFVSRRRIGIEHATDDEGRRIVVERGTGQPLPHDAETDKA